MYCCYQSSLLFSVSFAFLLGKTTSSAVVTTKTFGYYPERIFRKKQNADFLAFRQAIDNLFEKQRNLAIDAAAKTGTVNIPASITNRNLQSGNMYGTCAAYGDNNEMLNTWSVECAMEVYPLLNGEVDADILVRWCDDSDTDSSRSCNSRLNELMDIAFEDGSENCRVQAQLISSYTNLCLKHPVTNEYCWIDTPLDVGVLEMVDQLDTDEKLEEFCSSCYFVIIQRTQQMMQEMMGNNSEGGGSLSADMICTKINGRYCFPIFNQASMTNVTGSDVVDSDTFCHPCMEFAFSFAQTNKTEPLKDAHDQLCNTTDENGVLCFDRVSPIFFDEENDNYYNTSCGYDEGVCNSNCKEFFNSMESRAGCCYEALILLAEAESDSFANSSNYTFYDYVTDTCDREMPARCAYIDSDGKGEYFEMMSLSNCQRIVEQADLNNDTMLDSIEYVKFITLLPVNDKTFDDTTIFADLPNSLQIIFNASVNDGGMINATADRGNSNSGGSNIFHSNNNMNNYNNSSRNIGPPGSNRPPDSNGPPGGVGGFLQGLCNRANEILFGLSDASNEGQVDRPKCFDIIASLEINDDSKINNNEYMTFINQLSKYYFNGQPVFDLPPSIQMILDNASQMISNDNANQPVNGSTSLMTSNGTMGNGPPNNTSINGNHSGADMLMHRNVSRGLDMPYLESICEKLEEALVEMFGDRGSRILTIVSQFVVAGNIDGIDDDTFFALLDDAFKEFVWQVTMAVNEGEGVRGQQQQQSPILRRGLRKLIVILDEDSVEIQSYTDCPAEIQGEYSFCRVASGTYDILVTDDHSEDPQSVELQYLEMTQTNIEDGKLLEIVKSDPGLADYDVAIEPFDTSSLIEPENAAAIDSTMDDNTEADNTAASTPDTASSTDAANTADNNDSTPAAAVPVTAAPATVDPDTAAPAAEVPSEGESSATYFTCSFLLWSLNIFLFITLSYIKW